MIRNAFLAGLVTLGAAGAAQAADVRITGGGDSMTVEYIDPAPNHNVVGGAVVRMEGGGDNAAYTVERVARVRHGRDVVLTGGGDEARFVVRDAAGRAPRG